MDWATGAMFNLEPTHVKAGLTKRNEDDHPKGQGGGPPPTEVVSAASPQSWWVHSYARTCEGCRVTRMQEDTLGVVDAHGVEETVPLEEIYLISSGAREKPGALLRMSLWKMLGTGVGTVALGATGLAVGALALPLFRTSEEDTSDLITFTIVIACVRAVLGDVKGFFMRPTDEAPPDFQALMADWSVEQKRGWFRHNVLR